jgi:ketosteroid isomerase-like protein
MSQENVELALRAYDAFNRRDWDAFVALMDEDVEIVTRIAAIEGGRHGHDGQLRTDDRDDVGGPQPPEVVVAQRAGVSDQPPDLHGHTVDR